MIRLKNWKHCGLLGACAVALMISGCGGNKAKLVPAEGVVLIDGQPAEGIMVQFVPVTLDEAIDAPTSQAITDAEGKFVLQTMDNRPGAVPGPHKVTLIDSLEDRPAQGEESSRPPRIDPKYTTQGLDIEIVEGQPIEIKVSSGRR